MINTKILLETGCNHQGEFDIAVQMIEEAQKIENIWGIKFQKRDIESIPNDVKIKPRSSNNSFGSNYYEHRKALEFANDQMKKLKDITEQKGLQFVCSAFDSKSINDLISIGCKYIKLPSQLFSNKKLRKQLLDGKQKYNYKILVSTGMHEWNEINDNPWLDKADIIFHCISTYPAKLTEMNLDTIRQLKDITISNIGYSSHENEGYGIPFAVFAGATYIERHFTLNTEWKGSDHGTVSSDPDEIRKIISDIKWVEKILGTQDRLCKLKERQVRKIYRGF
jgi:sialic acid synthase SpsE